MTLMSIPVSKPVPVPMKKEERWKYALAIAIVVLLVLLLLLLLAFGAGPLGTGPGGAGQGGSSAGDGAGGVAGTAAADSIGDSTGNGTGGDDPAMVNTIEVDSDPTSEVGNASEADKGTNDGIESPIAADIPETPRDMAIEELIRRLSADSDDDASSPSDPDRRNSQSGGDALVKGDATVNFFGATGKGSKFVFVFDRSSSMTGRPLEAVKRELIKSLEPLRSNHTFNIISYDSRYEMWRPRLVSATQENKVSAIRFVEETDARGGTEPRMPLLEAINQRPEVIFFMTDGEFTLDVLEIVRSGRGIMINTVQFSDGHPLLVLQELARRTGGEFMLIPVRGLSDAL